jgi:hypothetical protein
MNLIYEMGKIMTRKKRSSTHRTSLVGVRVTPAERKRILRAALKVGLDTSTYIRMTVLGALDEKR